MKTMQMKNIAETFAESIALGSLRIALFFLVFCLE